MIFMAILLGLTWHVFAGAFVVGVAPSTAAATSSVMRSHRGIWASYLEPYRNWDWFNQWSVQGQVVLLFLPPVLMFVVLWESCSGLLWGLGAFVITAISFVLTCDGYRYIDYLRRFGDVSFSNLKMGELGLSDDAQEGFFVVTPKSLYETLFLRAAPKRMTALRKAVLTDGLVHVVLHFFVVLFWFVCLGPLATILISIALAVLLSETIDQKVIQRVGSVMHWVAWLPTRLFSLTLFLVLREDKTSLQQWWLSVKRADQGVPEVVLVTLRLVWSQRAQSIRGVSESANLNWPCADFTDMHSAVKKVILLWLGVIALLSILL